MIIVGLECGNCGYKQERKKLMICKKCEREGMLWHKSGLCSFCREIGLGDENDM